MALIIFDPCTIGVSETPEGCAFQIGEVDGFEGHRFMIPISTERMEKVVEAMQEIIRNKPQVEVADMATMKREVHRGGTPGTPA